MRAGERLIANDGYEVMLFPLEYMNISQGENGSYSHQGTYNIDFLGWGANGRILKCPYYAPCSCRCVQAWGGGSNANGRIYQSDNKVHTPYGLQYVNFLFFHDDNPSSIVGTHFNQGDLIGHTGTEGIGVTGDHVHMNTANGTYQGYEHVPPDNRGQLINSNHIYDICYVNDTVLYNDYNYNWQIYQGGITPTEPKKYHFKWVLYANKIRERNNS